METATRIKSSPFRYSLVTLSALLIWIRLFICCLCVLSRFSAFEKQRTNDAAHQMKSDVIIISLLHFIFFSSTTRSKIIQFSTLFIFTFLSSSHNPLVIIMHDPRRDIIESTLTSIPLITNAPISDRFIADCRDRAVSVLGLDPDCAMARLIDTENRNDFETGLDAEYRKLYNRAARFTGKKVGMGQGTKTPYPAVMNFQAHIQKPKPQQQQYHYGAGVGNTSSSSSNKVNNNNINQAGIGNANNAGGALRSRSNNNNNNNTNRANSTAMANNTTRSRAGSTTRQPSISQQQQQQQDLHGSHQYVSTDAAPVTILRNNNNNNQNNNNAMMIMSNLSNMSNPNNYSGNNNSNYLNNSNGKTNAYFDTPPEFPGLGSPSPLASD